MARNADGEDVVPPAAHRHVFTPGDFVIVGAAFFTIAFFAVMAILIIWIRCNNGVRRRRQHASSSSRSGPIIPTHTRSPSPPPSPGEHTIERGVLTERLTTAPVVSSYFRRLWQRWRATRGKDIRDDTRNGDDDDGDDDAARQEEGRAFDEDVDVGGVFYVRNGEMRTMRQRPARTSPSEFRDSAHALRAGTFDRQWQHSGATVSFGQSIRGAADRSGSGGGGGGGGADEDDMIPTGAQSDSAAMIRPTRRIIHRVPGAPRAHAVPSLPSPAYHTASRTFVEDNPAAIYATARGDAYDDDDDDDDDDEEDEEETEGDYSQGEDSDQSYRYASINHGGLSTMAVHDPEAHQHYVLMQQEQRRAREGAHNQPVVY